MCGVSRAIPAVDRSGGVLGLNLGFDDDGIDEFADHLLLGLGQADDGVELLFEARGGTTPAGDAGGGLAKQHLVEREIEHFSKARQKIGSDGRAGHLVMGKGLLGDPQLFGECLLSESTLFARGGDARAQFLEESFVFDSDICDDPWDDGRGCWSGYTPVLAWRD